MQRVAFLIDGFNVYHSMLEIEEQGYPCMKWLDLWSLGQWYLANLEQRAETASVHYFSAIAEFKRHTEPQAIYRHEDYIRCLKDSGVIVHLGHFQKKPVKCEHCQKRIKLREEKATDVAIGVKAMELLFRDEADIVVIVSGDTDQLPVYRTATRLFPKKEVHFLFPFDRDSTQILQEAKHTTMLRPATYMLNQFLDPYTMRGAPGTTVARPASWTDVE